MIICKIAQYFYQKAIEIQERVLGPSHPDIARSYNNIGGVYNSLGRYDNALFYFQKSLEIKLVSLSGKNTDIANTYHNMGVVFENLNNDEKAVEFHRKAMEIWSEVLGADSDYTILARRSIESIKRRMRKKQRKR